MDLCRALDVSQLPAHCKVCVATYFAAPLAGEQPGTIRIVEHLLPTFIGGVHQLQLEAPKVTLYGSLQPASAEQAYPSHAATLACYLSTMPGLKRVSIWAPTNIQGLGAHVGDKRGWSHCICPDVHSLAAALGTGSMVYSVSIEQNYVIVEYAR